MTHDPFMDEPPQSAVLTSYDRAHMKLYLRLLDADADGADWREAVPILFGIDPDREPERARLIHNTHRNTQPWKTGLPVDYRPPQKAGSLRPADIWHRVRRSLFGEYALLGQYKKHPDANQERLFFALLRECVEKDIVTQDMIEDQMRKNHVRHDALEVIARTPTLIERPLFAA